MAKYGFLTPLLAAALACGAAHALHYSGYAGTTVYGYQPAAGGGDQTDTFSPVRFRLDHDTLAGNFAVVANGRLYKGFGDAADSNGRVYYGYLRWRDPRQLVELDAGRQYIATDPAVGTIDGVRAVVGQGKKWHVDLYGGATVIPDFGAMRRFSTPTPAQVNDPLDRGYWRDNAAYGFYGGANVKELWSGMPFGWWLGTGLAVGKKAGHRSATDLGVDSSQDIATAVKLSQEIRYDYIGHRFNYQYYVFRCRPSRPLTTYVDYQWKEPRFDYTSIFSVFARKERSRARVGAHYAINDKFQPFADYSLMMTGDNRGHGVRAGLDQDFGYAVLDYGGLYGVGKRGFPGGDEYGAFGSASFPRVIPSWEPMSAGTSIQYLKYKGYGGATVVPAWKNVMLYDLHATFKIWRYFETTVGGEALKNPDRNAAVRAYIQASASITR